MLYNLLSTYIINIIIGYTLSVVKVIALRLLYNLVGDNKIEK
jgi:hypothetical protein